MALKGKDEGVSRGFEEFACAHSSRRTPNLMQQIGQWKDDPALRYVMGDG